MLGNVLCTRAIHSRVENEKRMSEIKILFNIFKSISCIALYKIVRHKTYKKFLFNY